MGFIFANAIMLRPDRSIFIFTLRRFALFDIPD